MIELDLRTGMLAVPALAAALAARCYPEKMPQTVVLPAATYSLVSSPPGLVYGGRSGKRHARIHWVANALTYAEARALAGKIRDAAEGLTGVYGSSDIEGVNVLDVSSIDLPDTVPGLALHRVRVDMSVWYKEV